MKEFNVKQKVWYMNNNEPKQGEISSKMRIDGKLEIGYTAIGEEGLENQLFYKVDYSVLPGDKVFETRMDLRNSLFEEETEHA